MKYNCSDIKPPLIGSRKERKAAYACTPAIKHNAKNAKPPGRKALKALTGLNINNPGQRPGIRLPLIKPRHLQTKIRVIFLHGAELILQPIGASLDFQADIIFHPIIPN
ncbi:MAG: hypothetical protein JXB49_27170 [Bacteroidales bacterium]|nr:hypothetical protein [Bacteroidales bacterium]